jgi:hypothetical protein
MSMLATLLDAEGGQAGGPIGAIFESWVDHDEVDFGYRMAEGHPPEADDEVALNVAAARDAGYELGDEVTVLLPEGAPPTAWSAPSGSSTPTASPGWWPSRSR